MIPITGIAGCCARAISGHVAAEPPIKVMNSRRLMAALETDEPYHIMKRVALCVTANFSCLWQLWVISCHDAVATRCPLYPRKLPRVASRIEAFTGGQNIIAELNRAKLGYLPFCCCESKKRAKTEGQHS